MNQVPIVKDYFELDKHFEHFLAYSNFGELTEAELTRLKTAYCDGGWYDTVSEFGYDIAIKAIKLGLRVARTSWNGKGQFVFMVPERTSRAYDSPLNATAEAGTMIKRRAYLALRTVNGEVVPWVPSQSDNIENDWFIVTD